MIGLGTIINTVGIVVGGLAGMLFGKKMSDRIQQTLTAACGVSVLFIGMAGAMGYMLQLQQDGTLTSGQSMFVVLCILAGAFVGELINIERGIEKFGEWLKVRTGNGQDSLFVTAFMTASFTVCIGAMAIVGSIQDGIAGDPTILITKTILDFIIVAVMTCSLGKGCIFSAIPVLILEGGITLLARLIKPLMTDAAMANLSLIGSILIFCVGVNLVWGKKVRVANLLPALIFAVVAAFLPF